MMAAWKCRPSSPKSSPAHRAAIRALSTAAGGEGYAKKSPHNFVAQPAKKKAGAPLGNRHAARRDPQMVERHARLDALVHQVCTLAAAAEASVRERNRQRVVLTALLAEPCT